MRCCPVEGIWRSAMRRLTTSSSFRRRVCPRSWTARLRDAVLDAGPHPDASGRTCHCRICRESTSGADSAVIWATFTALSRSTPISLLLSTRCSNSLVTKHIPDTILTTPCAMCSLSAQKICLNSWLNRPSVRDRWPRKPRRRFPSKLSFPGQERVGFERDRLFPLAGLNPQRTERYLRVEQLVDQLHQAIPPIARDFLDGKLGFVRAGWALEAPTLMAHSDATSEYMNEYRSYI